MRPIVCSLFIAVLASISFGQDALYGVLSSIGTNSDGLATTTDAIVVIDPVTGEGQLVGGIADDSGTEFAFVTSLAYDPLSDELLAFNEVLPRVLLAIERTTGRVIRQTSLDATGLPTNSTTVIFGGLTFDAIEGRLLAVENVSDQLVEISPMTGVVASITGQPSSLRQPGQDNLVASSISFDANNDLVFYDTLLDGFFRTSLSPNVVTPSMLGIDLEVSPFVTGIDVSAMVVDPDSGTIYGADTVGVNIFFSASEDGTIQVIREAQDSNGGIDLNLSGLTFAPPPGCTPVDYAAPFSTLDAVDIAQFLTLAFNDRSEADLTGDSNVDIFDVLEGLRLFDAGCP